ncbi:hypothetical protein M0657_009692 [Pyricularia oryzae]|uniref:Uncharacterized protein n=1 Tax=Pyricularia oryzae TaxID=318829 RepID=A0A4P7N413_PYROR|nr:hypothetical protein M0657_009692 [Pyricularia oryzae]KAI7924912.1 hypothetical protein M9X92_003624 [Pyricularia oryzae]QBZ57199.1 hypothetical protein PoMZ_02123 [Pyricularia oryzae]
MTGITLSPSGFGNSPVSPFVPSIKFDLRTWSSLWDFHMRAWDVFSGVLVRALGAHKMKTDKMASNVGVFRALCNREFIQ